MIGTKMTKTLGIKTQGIKAVAVAALIAIASSCGSGTAIKPASTISTQPAAATQGPVVDSSELPAILAQYHPVILAVGAQAETGVPGFLNGAIQADADQWLAASNTQAKLDDLTAWDNLIGGLGISAGTTVVLYDDGEMKFASRVRFLLYHFGVTRTYLVNGGWPALSQSAGAGRLLTQSLPSTPVAQNYVAKITNTPIPIIGRAQVAADLNQAGIVILDVRTPMEYSGTLLLPPVTRGGHIPGAVNLPVGDLFETGSSTMLLEGNGLLSVFAAHGVVPAKTIVVYCQDGAKSSLAATLLKQSGFPNVDLYYLSYSDWQADPNSPIEN